MSNNSTIDYEPSGDELADQRWLMSQGMSLEAANETIHAAQAKRIVDLRSKKPTAPQAESQSTILASLTKQYQEAFIADGLDAETAFDLASEKAFKTLKSPDGARLLSSVQLPGTSPKIESLPGYSQQSTADAAAGAKAQTRQLQKLDKAAIARFVKEQASVDDVRSLLQAVGSRLDQLAATAPDDVAALRKQWFAEAGQPVSPTSMKLGSMTLGEFAQRRRARRAG